MQYGDIMTTVHRTTFVRHSLKTIEDTIEHFLQRRYLPIAMIALHLIWLFLIVWTGTNLNWSKLATLAVYSILSAVVVILLPATILNKLQHIKVWLIQKESRLILTLCLIALVVGAVYANIQRVWGDEGRSLGVAQILSVEGLEAGYLSSGWLRNRHPPLMPLIYGFTVKLLGADLVYLRMVSVLFMAATLVVTYLLGRDLYDRRTGLLASFLMLSFPLVIRIGASAMMDMQVSFFFSLTLLLILRLSRKPSQWLAIIAGTVVGFGLLTKYMMALIFPLLLFYFIFKRDFRRIKYYLLVTALTATALFSIWLFYANHIGILTMQIQKITRESAIFYILGDFGVRLQHSQSVLMAEEIDNLIVQAKSGITRLGMESLFTRIPSSLGVYNFPFILFGAIYLLRRRAASDWFILFWVGVVFILLFITLPDHRYFLPTFPAIAIMSARMFNRFPRQLDRALLLSLLLWGGNLYLFVDWVREAHLFLK